MPAIRGAIALFRSEPVAGRCRVLCYHPDHNKTLADMTEQEALAVVQLWASEVGALRQSHQWVQVFENRGEMMGCSNAHPHGQIWAVDTLPNEGAKELAQQQASLMRRGGAAGGLPRRGRAAQSALLFRKNTGQCWCPIGQCGPSRRCCCRGARSITSMP